MGKFIFISHAVADKAVADALVDLLRQLNLTDHHFFCSSLEGMKIKEGKNFVDYIHDKIVEATLVIPLLSPHYFESFFCIAEMGACWALNKDSFPILISPTDYPDLRDTLTAIQARKADDKDTYSALRDTVVELLALKETSTAKWEAKRDAFLKHLPTILATIGNPKRATWLAYSKTQAAYEDAKAVITLQQTLIEKLKAAKDAKAVAAIVEAETGEHEQFEKLCRSAAYAIQSTNPVDIFIRIVFSHYSGIPFKAMTSQSNQVKALQEYNLVREAGDGQLSIDEKHPKIQHILASLESLEAFLKDSSDDFKDQFIASQKYHPKLSDRHLWDDYLGM